MGDRKLPSGIARGSHVAPVRQVVRGGSMAAESSEDWVPLYARISESGISEFTRLNPGVPVWMRESLWEWLRERIGHYRMASPRSSYFVPYSSLMRELERICRIDTGWPGGEEYGTLMEGLRALRQTLYENEIAFLTAVDFRLSRVNDTGVIDQLATILSEAGSEWRVGAIGPQYGLVKRIDDTVQRAAEEVASKGTRAGRLLAGAWRHAFSMQRDPSASYRCSVRAVEAAAGPVLTPRDPRPSLGKMIPALRDGMQKWNFAFTVDSAVDPKNVLLQMMQLLWTNEYSRHVDSDPATPLHVSQEEAESAVVLALTLVNWFTSGAVVSA